MIERYSEQVNRKKKEIECAIGVLYGSRYIVCPLCLLSHIQILHSVYFIRFVHLFTLFLIHLLLRLWQDKKFAQPSFPNYKCYAMLCNAMAMKIKLNEMKRSEVKRNETKRNDTQHHITLQYKQWLPKMSNRCLFLSVYVWVQCLKTEFEYAKNVIATAVISILVLQLVHLLFKSSANIEDRRRTRGSSKIIIINRMKQQRIEKRKKKEKWNGKWNRESCVVYAQVRLCFMFIKSLAYS